MRTIKFRGKRVDNGEWVYGGSIIKFNDDGVVTYYMPSINEKCIVVYDEFENIVQFEKGSFYLRIQREFFRILGTLDKDKMYIKTRFGRRIKKDFSKLIENINPDVIITFDPKSLLVLKCLLKNTLPLS